MDNRQLTARQAVAIFLRERQRLLPAAERLDPDAVAIDIVQHLYDNGFLVVRRGDASHGIQPPTGEMGAVPS